MYGHGQGYGFAMNLTDGYYNTIYESLNQEIESKVEIVS
jgi:hypothetical protein